ncbi:unnamed protein product [Scytosiphon promiscuus]
MLTNMVFPFVEDTSEQDLGEETWCSAFAMVKELVWHAGNLVRRSKGKLYRVTDVAEHSIKDNRWRTVHVLCGQGGQPENQVRSPDPNARRRTTSKKASMCLYQYAEGSKDSGIEHGRPRVFDNELTTKEIQEQSDVIIRLHSHKVDTRQIHKALQGPGKRLGEQGKQMVRNIRTKFDKTIAANNRAFSDAQTILPHLRPEGCWMRFKVDAAGRIACVAWAHEVRWLNVLRYHSVIIQDNTFNTNV